MSSVESVAVDSAGTHAGSQVPVKALRSMALGERGDVVVVGGGGGGSLSSSSPSSSSINLERV